MWGRAVEDLLLPVSCGLPFSLRSSRHAYIWKRRHAVEGWPACWTAVERALLRRVN